MIFISGGQRNPDNYDSEFASELQTMLDELSDNDCNDYAVKKCFTTLHKDGE